MIKKRFDLRKILFTVAGVLVLTGGALRRYGRQLLRVGHR
jgi:hypothetical protein